MHQMRVMGKSGDNKVFWDPDNPAEVDTARTTWLELVQKGYTAFKVEEGTGEMIGVFDPKVEYMVMVPRIAGG